MAYRIPFSSPGRSTTGRKRERGARKHRVPRARTGEFPRVSRNSLGVARRGGRETVNYHPLNNRTVYDSRRRRIRAPPELAVATSLLNFLLV